MAVFTPNLTSRLIVKVAARKCRSGDFRFLEVGCGSGYITKELLTAGHLNPENCWLSDISVDAVENAKLNLRGLVEPQRIEVGPCLTPWRGHKFDLIVSDVAGISEEIAEASDWYNGIPSSCGPDGLTNTLEVLRSAGALLRESGSLVFPVISLSDVVRLKSAIEAEFYHIEFQEETVWPLPQDLASNLTLLERLSNDRKISIERKYGKILAATSIAVCSKPSNG